jgi:hypothetical protein
MLLAKAPGANSKTQKVRQPRIRIRVGDTTISNSLTQDTALEVGKEKFDARQGLEDGAVAKVAEVHAGRIDLRKSRLQQWLAAVVMVVHAKDCAAHASHVELVQSPERRIQALVGVIPSCHNSTP